MALLKKVAPGVRYRIRGYPANSSVRNEGIKQRWV
jgi:hypothetical protein